MSLLTGNVVDKDNNSINCNFQMLHYNTGKLSVVRDTELNQWSIDTDDSDVNNQAAAFSVGDIVILHYWIENQCSVVKVVSDGSDSYVFDVQLRDCVVPSVSLFLSDGIIGEAVVATSSSSDEYQWDYLGTTHYHKNSWYGMVWCESVGIFSVEYDFGNGYNSLSNNTFTITGEHSVSVKATNICGLFAIDTGVINIKYPSPKVSLSYSGNLTTGGTVLLSESTIDNYSRIISQTFFIDGVETQIGNRVFDNHGIFEYKCITIWNDGFEDRILTTKTNIEIISFGPVVVVVNHINTERFYKITPDIVPGDGAIVGITYIIEYRTPIDNIYKTIYDSQDNLPNMTFEFTESGQYKITVIALDEFGKTGTNFTETIVSCEVCEECEECEEQEGGDNGESVDCTDAIRLAIENYKLENPERDHHDKPIVVSDGKHGNHGKGKLIKIIAGDLDKNRMQGDIGGSMSGNIGGGKIGGSLGGKISGNIKK